MNDETDLADDWIVADGGTPQGIQELLDAIQLGGPVSVILAGMSVIALAIMFVKLWQFHASGVWRRSPARHALALYRAGRAPEAQALAARGRDPVAMTLACAIRGQRRGVPESKVREEVARFGGDMIESLRSWFRPLEVIASLAPLLGLFGTVLGMIEAFRQLEQAGNQVNPAVLSGGIWEALLTTAVGLAVAIPVVAIVNWLERVVDRLGYEMESVLTQVFTEDLSEHVETADPDLGRYRAATAPSG